MDLLGEIGDPREPFLVAFLWLANSEDHFHAAASDNSVAVSPRHQLAFGPSSGAKNEGGSHGYAPCSQDTGILYSPQSDPQDQVK